MSLSSSDERALVLPLLEGAQEQPCWRNFLAGLARRTGAAHAVLVVRPAGPSFLRPMVRQERRPGQGEGPLLDVGALEGGVFPAFSDLRPGRVYALAEFAPPAGGEGVRPAGLLRDSSLADARILQVPVTPGLKAWLLIADDRLPFAAADSAVLSALAPFVAVALRRWADEQALRARLSGAEQLLERMGIDFAQLDAAGRILSGPALSGELPSPSSRLRIVALPTATAWAATQVRRHRGARRDAAIAAALREEFHLSAQEAALAWAIACGESLAQAGQRLGLTVETTRNYSKRIYAKTGTSGQAHLAQLCHEHAARLA